MYMKEKGIRQTIISFEPFFRREGVRSLRDREIAKKFHISLDVVKDMKFNRNVPFDTIRQLCHELRCQPGDILKAIECEYFPANGEGPDA